MKYDLLRPGIIVEHHRLQAQGLGGMTFQGAADIVRLYRPGEVLHREDTEMAQARGTVIYVPTGHVHIRDQELDPARSLRDRGPVLHRDALKVTDVGTVHRHHHEEEGKGGVPATRAFLAAATEVGAGVGVGMDAEGSL